MRLVGRNADEKQEKKRKKSEPTVPGDGDGDERGDRVRQKPVAALNPTDERHTCCVRPSPASSSRAGENAARLRSYADTIAAAVSRRA